jgi:SAM-dependent methyltransferase
MVGEVGAPGAGPGAITPDGCAVEFYARLPAHGEPGIVHEAGRPGASILDLGCGTGRIADPLVALGHPVVAVDESPEMLAHVRSAETVRARIQDLSLGRRFGVVLLASHLVHADPATRAAFLATCRRHVADDGCVVIQLHPPEWFSTAAATEDSRDGIVFRMRDVSRPAPGLLSATVEYLTGEQRWTQTFTAVRLDEAELAAVLAAAGLRLDRYLTADRAWLRAVPASGGADGSLAALAAERAAAGRRAVRAVHLAGARRGAFGARGRVRGALALQRLAELALHLGEVGPGRPACGRRPACRRGIRPCRRGIRP